MPLEVFRLNLERLMRALGAKENLDRELQDGITMVIDVSQFLDGALTGPAGSAGAVSPLLRYIAAPAVAAGADWSISVPAGVRWRVVYLSGRLTTAVAVANRQPNMTVTTPIPTTLGHLSPFVQAASLTVTWKWFPGAPDFSAQGVNDVAFPPESVLGGFSIGPVTAALQAADQWDQMGALFEEFSL